MADSSEKTEHTLLEKTEYTFGDDEQAAEQHQELTQKTLKERFELLEPIGDGGMGKVYKAIDKRDVEAGDSRFIAIKVLHSKFQNNPNILKALHNETRKSQSLTHENIIRVYDFDRDEHSVFMHMEYLEGTSLDKIIYAHPEGMEPKMAFHYVRQIVAALQYAHQQGIIHSDLKPGNIFVDLNEHVKVLDFGIARLLNFNRTNHFDAGVISAYTPGYASLEMIYGNDPDYKDDVFALACITYELLAGHHPYERVSADEAFQQKMEALPIDKLSSAQWEALTGGLSLQAVTRTESVEKFWQGLQNTNKPIYRRPLFILLLFCFLILGLRLFELDHYLNRQQTEQAEVVLPPSIESTEVTTVFSASKIDLAINQQEFKIGDLLQIDFQVDRDAYVRIVLINSNNELVHIFPNPFQTKNFCLANKLYQLPPKNAEFTLEIDPPPGVDRIIAIAGPVPFSESFFKFDQNAQFVADELPDSFSYIEQQYVITAFEKL